MTVNQNVRFLPEWNPKDMGEQLIGLRTLQDFLELLLWTGQLDDERPVSAILVAPPGAGKTSMLELVACEQALLVGDLTARTIGQICRNDKLTHILLGDMLSLFGHKQSTVDLTVRLISQLTGEDLKQDPFQGTDIKPVRLGLIAAIPPDDMKKAKIRTHIEGGGFASRFIIVRYSYSLATIDAIHNFIMNNGYADHPPKPFIMKNIGRLRVRIPKSIGPDIKSLSLYVKKQGDFGFRAHRHIRSLAKAAARREGRVEVNVKDLNLVKMHCEFFAKPEGKEL
jgi:hypothetical protein